MTAVCGAAVAAAVLGVMMAWRVVRRPWCSPRTPWDTERGSYDHIWGE